MTTDNPHTDVLLFFNPAEARELDALVDRIIPGEPGSPGASEAGVLRYIDQGLAGFLRDLQTTYRRGLLELGELARRSGRGRFADLDIPTRERIVADLDRIGREDPDDFTGQFFRIVREHTVQGFFGDPAYGGNTDLAGWRLVGFPGAQWSYTPDQMQPGFDASRIPMFTVSDLYRRLGDHR
ncbi:gluconate 2-dehydrogenase subunit 3 family protein [Nakamurella endophytica]|nr:gluconate 2-dehydrogenase subunit 3 family protein [Nakamurella endophytica]